MNLPYNRTLYFFVLSIIARLIVIAGNMRTADHGYTPYMQQRVINAVGELLPGYREYFGYPNVKEWALGRETPEWAKVKPNEN